MLHSNFFLEPVTMLRSNAKVEKAQDS